MARSERKRSKDFLAAFELDGDPYLAPDRLSGRPGLQAATDEAGEPVLIKTWLRQASRQEADLRELWAHELRQLHRLAGYPGVTELTAAVVKSGVDAQGYHLILDPGPRRPLQALLDHAPNSHWIKQPRADRHRARLWRNLKRIAGALELLHAQGLLHRNVDAWAVLAGGDEDLDFQLTGFEWSMRIVTAGAAAELRKSAKLATYDSFARDWSMFGGLAAQLCGVSVTRLIDRAIAPSDVAAHLNPDEIRFLRSLADIDPFERMDGETISASIDGILAGLASEITGQDPKRYLVVRLGPRSELSQRIRAFSQGDIELDDTARQMTFIRADLSRDAQALAIKTSEETSEFRLAVHGRNLIYKLRPYAPPRSQEPPGWDFAECNRVDLKKPTPGFLLGDEELPLNAIEVLSPAEAAERFGRLRGKLTSWEGLRQSFEAGTSVQPPEEMFRRALVLSQFLEMLQAACDVFPVDVEHLKPVSGASEDGRSRIAVVFRNDPDRDALSKIFGSRSQVRRFEDRLQGEEGAADGIWQLSDSAYLGDRTPDVTDWQFREVRETGVGRLYIFHGAAPPGLSEGFLTPEGALGRDAVFRRRLKALRALREHTELLAMMTDPRRRILDSEEVAVEDDAFLDLDGPKQQAMREVVSTLPLYLVQGPPGVGKTRLVRELVKRRFEDDPISRLLLSAQSNAAVNHLMDEVVSGLAMGVADSPLVIRCMSRETREAPHPLEVAPQTTDILARLAISKLVAEALPKLRQRIEALNRASTKQDRPARSRSGWSMDADRRGFESIIMRSANLVFATTNSAELEKLIDERGQCDWSIVEESAKATGGELVSPALLSHRRFMIGDHKQLPPFGSEQMVKLLADPTEVRKALRVGRLLIGRSLRGADTDDDLDEIEDDQFDLPALCGEASRSYLLFETLIEREFRQLTRDHPGRRLARPLSRQHRMHPKIAALVSNAFYNDDLKTDDGAADRFADGAPPFQSVDPAVLPDAPIVIVDMPYLQSTLNMRVAEELPAFTNRREQAAVMRVLEVLRADPAAAKPPSLAVLSPYRRQVTQLSRQIAGGLGGSLAHLKGFTPTQKAGAFTGTVDSFQGNEADIVVVSLVRNNGFTHPRRALGFLTDERRMNVLLSRARWRLVLVVSREFLGAVLDAPRPAGDITDLGFLSRIREHLNMGIESGAIARVDGATLVAAS